MSEPFHIVDFFTSRPFAGNPVAVMLASDQDEATMRAVAAWTGMPETVFIGSPTRDDADYAVRIFSPVRELAFAGHPSIGACHLLVELGLARPCSGRLRQQCPGGLFDMRVDDDGGRRSIGFTVLVEKVSPLTRALSADLARSLNAPFAVAFLVEAGAKWIIARVREPADLAALKPNLDAIRDLSDRAGVLGVSVFSPSPDADADIEVRSFAPSIGVAEDAVCGGGNACVAAVIAHERSDNDPVTAYTASQGRHLGRNGRVRLLASKLDRTVLVAGEAVTTTSGTIALGRGRTEVGRQVGARRPEAVS